MKKLYTFIIFLSLNYFVFAQDIYLIKPDLVINTTDVNATNLEDQTYLVNNSGQVVDVEYTINNGNFVTYDWPSAAVGICNNATCDDPSIKVSGSFTMNIGDSVNIKITLLPEGIADSIGGNLQFNFPGTTFSRVGGTYSIKAGNITTAIKKIDTKTISIYPNPASNFVQIKGIENINQVKTLEVYNIIGRKLISKQISSTSDLNVNIQNYESGIYLIKLFDESKNVSYTKTFVKK